MLFQQNNIYKRSEIRSIIGSLNSGSGMALVKEGKHKGDVICFNKLKSHYANYWIKNNQIMAYAPFRNYDPNWMEHKVNEATLSTKYNNNFIHLFEQITFSSSDYEYKGKFKFEYMLDDETKFLLVMDKTKVNLCKIEEENKKQVSNTEHTYSMMSKEELLKIIKSKQSIKDTLKQPSKRIIRSSVYERNPILKEYIKKQQEDICALCDKKPSNNTYESHLYLEAHHITGLSEGGLDILNNMIGLCPNCHRRVHKHKKLNKKLFKIKKEKGWTIC